MYQDPDTGEEFFFNHETRERRWIQSDRGLSQSPGNSNCVRGFRGGSRSSSARITRCTSSASSVSSVSSNRGSGPRGPRGSSSSSSASSASSVDGRSQEEAVAKLHHALQPGMVFATRTELTDKVKQSVLQYTGKGAQCDPRRCSGQRVVLRCPATMTSTPGQKASWKGDSLEGFTCRRKRGETAKTFAVRKNKQLEKFAGQKMCKFRAVGLKQKNSTWKLQQFDGRSFIPHDEDCLCYGNANGRVLVNLMQPAISAGL